MADQYMAVFSPACENHDFGYRNLGKGFIMPTDEMKTYVDTTFLRNMQATCDTLSASFKVELRATSLGIGCARAANIFFAAVNPGGGKAFYEEA